MGKKKSAKPKPKAKSAPAAKAKPKPATKLPTKGKKVQSLLGQPGVDAIHHKDKRANIPTHELRDFIADDEAAPRAMLYPRDPSLDPQLVWKGKDEQDAADLSVPVVPIYIQEKISPQVIIQDFLKSLDEPQAASSPPKSTTQQTFSFYDDFNGLPEEFDKRVEFYKWPGNWSNRMILGDSLQVMTYLFTAPSGAGVGHAVIAGGARTKPAGRACVGGP